MVLNCIAKIKQQKHNGNRGGCVPFRIKLFFVKKFQDRKTFRGYT